MEELSLNLPGGGELKALRLQDLPAEHVFMYLSMPPVLRIVGGSKLLELAGGESAATAMESMTYGEVATLVEQWVILSDESESDEGPGAGIDWSELLR